MSHRAHILRHQTGHFLDPFDTVFQCHHAHIREIHAGYHGRAGLFRQACAVTFGAHALLEKFFHASHALLVFNLGERVLDGSHSAIICEIQLGGHVACLGFIENVLFLHRTIIYNLLLLVGKPVERNVGPYTHCPAHIGHQRPHKAVPWSHGAFVDGLALIRDKGRAVNCHNHSCSIAPAAGSGAVECQIFRSRSVEMRAALFTHELLFGRDVESGNMIVSALGAFVRSKTREHKAQAVEQLCACSESASDAGHAGSLMQCYRGRDIHYVVDLRLGRLCHAPARVSRQRFQIAARPLRIQHAKSQRGFPRAGYAGDSNDFAERDIYIYIFEIMNSCSTDKNLIVISHITYSDI